MSDTTTTTAGGLTSEEVWKLIEPKINEYWRFAKFVLFFIGAVVPFFFGIIIALLKIEPVKDAIVLSLIKVDKLFDEDGKKFLNKQVDSYFRSEQPTFIFDPGASIPLKVKAIGVFDQRFAEHLKSAISNVIFTYSVSAGFDLSDSKKSDKFRFLKPEGSTADADCSSVYTTADARKNVQITLNDFTEQGVVTPKPKSSQGQGRVHLEKENAQYFQDKNKVEDIQTLTFVVDADTPFEGSIVVDCTVKITGPARLAAPGH
jgi:hypothetical protein